MKEINNCILLQTRKESEILYNYLLNSLERQIALGIDAEDMDFGYKNIVYGKYLTSESHFAIIYTNDMFDYIGKNRESSIYLPGWCVNNFKDVLIYNVISQESNKSNFNISLDSGHKICLFRETGSELYMKLKTYTANTREDLADLEFLLHTCHYINDADKIIYKHSASDDAMCRDSHGFSTFFRILQRSSLQEFSPYIDLSISYLSEFLNSSKAFEVYADYYPYCKNYIITITVNIKFSNLKIRRQDSRLDKYHKKMSFNDCIEYIQSLGKHIILIEERTQNILIEKNGIRYSIYFKNTINN